MLPRMFKVLAAPVFATLSAFARADAATAPDGAGAVHGVARSGSASSGIETLWSLGLGGVLIVAITRRRSRYVVDRAEACYVSGPQVGPPMGPQYAPANRLADPTMTPPWMRVRAPQDAELAAFCCGDDTVIELDSRVGGQRTLMIDITPPRAPIGSLRPRLEAPAAAGAAATNRESLATTS